MTHPTHTTEQWRAVPGYEGFYEVSDHGRVRSLDRTVVTKAGWAQRCLGKVLSPAINKLGYQHVNLSKENKQRSQNVHALVAEAFLGPRPEGYDVCHNDGNPKNNHVDNLRYDTRARNMADCVKHGTHARGDRHGQAKLDWPQVREIRTSYATGCVTQQELADYYGVSVGNVSLIVNYKAWTHDPQEQP